MATVPVVAPPSNISMVLTIQPGDGGLRHMLGEIGIGGPSGLGTGVVCVINMGGAVNNPASVNIQTILANVLFPLPFARYVLDWSQMKITGTF